MVIPMHHEIWQNIIVVQNEKQTYSSMTIKNQNTGVRISLKCLGEISDKR